MNRAVKIIAILFLAIALLIGVVFLGLQTPAGQKFVTQQVGKYLRKKLNTHFEIAHVRYDIPDWIALEGVYVEDQSGDTLVAGKRIYVNLDMWSLAKGQIRVNDVELEGIRAKVYRGTHELNFNYQFIVDAFASGDTTTTTSSPLDMEWKDLTAHNLHLTYTDIPGGTHADIMLPSGKVAFTAFNPSYNRYHPTSIALEGLRASIAMWQPTEQQQADVVAPVNSNDSLDIRLDKIVLSNTAIMYSDSVMGLYANASLPQMNVGFDKLFLQGQEVQLKQVLLSDAIGSVRLGAVNQPVELTPQLIDETISTGNTGWKVGVGEIIVKNTALKYDDEIVKPVTKGIDFNHLGILGLHTHIGQLYYSPDSTTGTLRTLQFKEKSGFQVDEGRTQFAYTSEETYLKDLFIKTPYTQLGDELVLTYPDFNTLTKKTEEATLQLNLSNSKVGFKDVLYLMPDMSDTPPFKGNLNGYILGNVQLTGKVGAIQIKRGELSMPTGTKINVAGSVKGLPSIDKTIVDLNIQEIATNKADLLRFMPDSSFSNAYNFPATIAVSGTVKGGINAVDVVADVRSDLGTVAITGMFTNMTDSLNAAYKGHLTVQNLALGEIMKRDSLEMGTVSLDADFSGTGYAVHTMDAQVNGVINSLFFNNYTYKDLNLTGNMKGGVGEISANSSDPNLNLFLSAKADLKETYPAIYATAKVDNVDLKALHFYPDPIGFKGNVTIDMTSTNIENPLGSIRITDGVLTENNRVIPLGAVEANLTNSNGVKTATLTSDFIKAELKGQFNYPDLGTILVSEMNKYFIISDTVVATYANPYHFTLNAGVRQHNAIKAILPALTRLDSVQFKSQFKSSADTTLMMELIAPRMVYDSIRVRNVAFQASGNGANMHYTGKIGLVEMDGFRVRNINLNGDVHDNDALLNFVVKDSLQKDQHAFTAKVKTDGKSYRANLQNRLLLNYRPWRTDSTGIIEYGPDGVLVKNFNIKRNRSQEQIIINTVAERGKTEILPNGPIRVQTDSVAIGPLVTLMTRDSTLANGRLDGDIYVRNYMTDQLGFFGNMKIFGLEVTQIPLGDFSMRAVNDTQERIRMEMALKSDLNDVSLKGNYNVSNTKNPLEFDVAINKLDAKTIEAFSFGELKNGEGNVSGKATLTGTPDSPLLNGALNFNDVSFRIKQLGAKYAIQNGKLDFQNEKIVFRNVAFVDTLQQKLNINGSVALTNLPNATYDLNINTNRFMLMNAGRRDNEYMYGQAFAAANINVKGRGVETVIDGSVKVLNGTDVTMILPDETAGVNRGDGVVEFVNKRRQVLTTDSSAMATPVVIDFASEMSLNIETDKDAQFTVVIDELNGDNLKLKGNAQLNTGLAPNGQLYLLGLYELEEGSYDLSLEILRKQFQIRKGSQLIWTGDPMKAELDITAVYEVLTDPSSLSPTSFKYGKVPFNVLLNISGNLSNPKVEFNLEVAPHADKSLKDKIDQEGIVRNFQTDPAEMNKQVFSLLILNKFMSQTSNVSFGGFNAEAIARQSVSKMLSDQLNNLASDLVKGVQLDFNLNSTTGAAGSRTDLNVGLTKGFLNDRITVSVGRNFELENSAKSAQSSEIFDNIAVNYKITRDGRYLVRAYRKNQFQTVLEGFVVETGVSFIITLDYDQIKEFFQE